MLLIFKSKYTSNQTTFKSNEKHSPGSPKIQLSHSSNVNVKICKQKAFKILERKESLNNLRIFGLCVTNNCQLECKVFEILQNSLQNWFRKLIYIEQLQSITSHNCSRYFNIYFALGLHLYKSSCPVRLKSEHAGRLRQLTV